MIKIKTTRPVTARISDIGADGREYNIRIIPAELDPELDPDAALAAGRYLAASMARGVSHVWNTGGREYYRNKRGRCEDAPCCGCCNA